MQKPLETMIKYLVRETYYTRQELEKMLDGAVERLYKIEKLCNKQK